MIENIYKGSYNNMAKITEAKYAANRRWDDANYKSYKINLRIDNDEKLIAYIEANKAAVGTTQIIREALQMLIDSKK